MTDLVRAKQLLAGHSLCLCKGEDVITDDGRGISPMMHLLADGADLNGYAAADLIVGKAAAMLFTLAGVAAVHGKVMSSAAKSYLEQGGIVCSFDTLTERIINRAGTDVCPMEKTVADIDDPAKGYTALRQKLAEMRNQHG